MFTPEQTDALKAKLDKAHVKGRAQGGRSVSYIMGWHAIAEANRIFGFDCWNRETVELRQLGMIYDNKNGNKVANYTAKVRITVRSGDTVTVRDGCGFGSGIDKDEGQAHESAIKEAETDAMKRALMTFGNPFGLALYDKEQTNVETTSAGEVAAINAIDACKSRAEILALLTRDQSQIKDLPNGGAQRVKDHAKARINKEFPQPKEVA